jgi:hypothetical protein
MMPVDYMKRSVASRERTTSSVLRRQNPSRYTATTMTECATRGTTARTRAARTIRHLHELIAALDRRVPQVKRSGEASIARAAASLRADALKRIADLEREAATGPVLDIAVGLDAVVKVTDSLTERPDGTP